MTVSLLVEEALTETLSDWESAALPALPVSHSLPAVTSRGGAGLSPTANVLIKPGYVMTEYSNYTVGGIYNISWDLNFQSPKFVI